MTTIDAGLKSKTEWVEMFPFGIAMGVSPSRPVMIFKDKLEKRVLPVWLSPIDAGIAVTQGNTPYGSAIRGEESPHEISWQILTAIGIRLEKCLFKKVKDHHQYVELHFSAIPTPPAKTKKAAGKNALEKDTAGLLNKNMSKVIEARADGAISFCLRSGCKFFATIDYIDKSRVLESDVMSSKKMKMPEVNPHPYLN